MNRRNSSTIIQEEYVILEYTYRNTIKAPVRKKGERVLVEKEVPKSEARKGIGSHRFEANPDYEFPIIRVPKSEADRILMSEERDGTNNFRVAVPKKTRRQAAE